VSCTYVLSFLCFQQLMTKQVHSVRFVQLIKGSLLTVRIAISDHQINLIRWIFFSFLQLAFACASIGSFWTMFGSMFFLVACLVFMVPLLSHSKEVLNEH
jgi:hypothetical protein